MSAPMIPKTYLGDAVYCEFDGWHLVLTAGTHTIYLEGEVLASLMRYAERAFNVKIDVQNPASKEEVI